MLKCLIDEGYSDCVDPSCCSHGIDNNYNSCEQCKYYYKNQSKIHVLKNSEIELVEDAFDFYCSCHGVFSSYNENVELRAKVDKIMNKLRR